MPIIPVGIGGQRGDDAQGRQVPAPSRAGAHRRRPDPAAGAHRAGPRAPERGRARSRRSSTTSSRTLFDEAQAPRRPPQPAPVSHPVRLVASDLDGTLLGVGDVGVGAHAARRSRRSPTRASTSSRPRAGASGRPRPLLAPVHGHRAASCAPTARRSTTSASGASLAELPDRRRRDRRDPRPASPSASRAASTAGRPSADLHYDAGFVDLPPGPRPPGQPATWRSGTAPAPIRKLMIAHAEVQHYALLDRARPAPARRAASPRPRARPFVEVTGDGRRQGLRRAAGVRAPGRRPPRRCVAFGDNHNDLAMLQWAGRGIAMANAPARGARRGGRGDGVPRRRTAWPPCSETLPLEELGAGEDLRGPGPRSARGGACRSRGRRPSGPSRRRTARPASTPRR